MIVGAGIEPLSLYVAGVRLNLTHIDDGLLVNQKTGSRFFINSQLPVTAEYNSSLLKLPKSQFPGGELLFTGKPWAGFDMPYRWHILKINNNIAITVDFDGLQGLDGAMVVVDPIAQTVCYYLDTVTDQLDFDVYENPLGILLTIYLAHYNHGIVIHASGVEDGGNGYLFTGVSGIGKSTMARLWQQNGATIVNDDRLVVMPHHEGYSIANTPMPYYDDMPKQALLRGMFLLRQAPENHCRQIGGAKALALLMANCMQHFHSKSMVKQHLVILENMVKQVPIYELGFKPDHDVVEMIRASTGTAPSFDKLSSKSTGSAHDTIN